MKNKERGITLVALVVTIIILLILAGVTLGIVFGNTGLFERTKKAAEIYQKKENEEEELIKNLEKDLDVYKGNNLVFTQEPTEWTKEKVTVTIENKLQWCKLEYLKDEETGEWEEYTDKIEVDTNKKIYARLVDGEKVIEYGAISIENIDNENPEVGEVIMRVGSKTGKLYKGDVVIQENLYLSMQEGKDNESGHEKTTYKIISGPITTEETTEEMEITEDGEYEIEVTTEDKVGNISKKTQIIKKYKWGAYTDYAVDIDDDENSYDWKIFYKGGESDGEANGRIFLIVDSTVILPKDIVTNIKVTGPNPGYYWTASLSASALDISKKDLFLATKYALNGTGACMSASMLTPKYWTYYLDDKFGDVAVGGLTPELLVTSWNSHEDKTKYPNMSCTYSGTGYRFVNCSSSALGWNDPLYGSGGSWLIAGCSSYPDRQLGWGKGAVYELLGKNNQNQHYFKPVVCLKEGAKYEWNEEKQLYSISL